MLLNDIPKKSKIYCEISDGSKYLIMDHLDGFYSYCVTENGSIMHLSCSTPLQKYKDGYEIEDIPKSK